MKNVVALVATAALAAQGVSGHYIFQSLSKGAAKGTAYEFVRRNTNYNSPVTGLSPYSNLRRDNIPVLRYDQTYLPPTSDATSAVPPEATQALLS